MLLDLDAVIADVRDQTLRQNLRRLVQRFEQFQWSSVDMEATIEALVLARRRDASRVSETLTPEESTIDGALGTRAFILYAEATARNDPHVALTPAQRVRHAEMRNIRKKAIAHREEHDHPSGEWFATSTLVDVNPSRWDIRFHWRRANYRAAALVDLEALARTILPYYDRKATELGSQILQLLQTAALDGHLIPNSPSILAAVVPPPREGLHYIRRIIEVEDGLVVNTPLDDGEAS